LWERLRQITDKERLDAITMNLKLVFRDLQQTSRDVAEMREENQPRAVQWKAESQHLSDMVTSVADTAQKILATEMAHQARIERLERKVG
jgi:hypothetical protein